MPGILCHPWNGDGAGVLILPSHVSVSDSVELGD